jgi:hypothetical protein
VRALARAALVLAGALALALVAVLAALPRWAESPSARRRMEAIAREALGREVGYERPAVSLLPPSLVLERPWLAGPDPAGARLLEAERLSLRLAWLPLLAGRVVLEALVVEGPVVRIARSREGLELPALSSAGGRGPGSLAVRRLDLRGATVVLRDSAVTPAVRSELHELDLELASEGREAPLWIAGAFVLGGGRVEASGSAAADGALDLALSFATLPLAAHAAYLSLPPEALAVVIDGEAHLRRDPGGSFDLEGRARLREGSVRLGGLALGRGAEAVVSLAGLPGAPRGRIEIDAQAAALALEGVFSKPAGEPAKLATRIGPGDRGGLVCEEVRLRLGGLEAEGRARFAEGRARLELASPTLDARALAALVPSLAEVPGLEGSLRIEDLVVETRPFSLTANVALEEVALAPGTAEPLRVRGALEVQQAAARAPSLAVEVGGQAAAVEGEISLAGGPAYALRVAAERVDAWPFLKGFLARAPGIEGRLDLAGELRGPLDTTSLVESAEGSLGIHVADGRLRGVSILAGALGALSLVDRLSGLSRVLGPEHGLRSLGPSAETGDRFQTLDATLQLAGGVARTSDLRIVYPAYRVALAGDLRLVEGTARMQGEIELLEPLLGPFGKGLGLLDLGCAMPNRIPLPEVSGPVYELQVRPDAAYVLGFVTRCGLLLPVRPLEALGKEVLRIPRAVGGALEAEWREEPGDAPQPE